MARDKSRLCNRIQLRQTAHERTSHASYLARARVTYPLRRFSLNERIRKKIQEMSTKSVTNIRNPRNIQEDIVKV